MRFLALITVLGFIPVSYASSNTATLLPEIKALALDKLVLDRTNVPVTVLETSPITDSNGKVAQGLTEIRVTLASDAVSSIIIQGKTLKPGETLKIVQDFSLTGGVLKIPFYPAESDVSGLSHYKIEIPKITAELCPDSYTQDTATSTCKKVNTTNLLYTCPDDWTVSGDVTKCTKQTEIPKVTCPSGYVSNMDGTCTKTEFQDTLVKCSTGYTYSATNDRCEKTIVEAASKTCPDSSYSYQAATNDCRKTVTQNVNFKCLSGFTYNATLKICERTLSAVATPACSTGYTYSAVNERCEKTVAQTASKVCATGYAYSATNDRCEKPLTEDADPVCSAGYAYSVTNKRCEKTLTQTASKVCATGYAYNSGSDRCEKTTTSAASAVCASGYTYSAANGRCEKTVTQTASKVCANGYSFSTTNNRCEKTTTSAASAVCASGYTYSAANGRCEKTVTQTASKVCASGYTYSATNNRCEKTTTSAASAVCASGYTYSAANSRCEKTVTQTASKVCASGYTYSATNNRCEKTTTSAASAVCASGYTYSAANSRCEKTLTQTASKVCASGYTYSATNNRCERTLVQTPVCSSGYTYNTATNVCESITTYSASCPSGTMVGQDGLCYTRASGYACDAYEFKNGYGSCKFINGACGCWKVSTKSDVTLPDACPSPSKGIDNVGSCGTVPGAAPSQCPVGSSLVNGSCQSVVTASASCSSGYALNVASDKCEKLETQAFSYNCPANYTLSGSTCSQLQTAANTWSCPNASYTLSGSTCSLLETQAFSYNCPTNYTLSGSTCSQLQTVANTWSCPSASYSLSGSTCSLLETQAFSYNCPTNYTLSGSTCSQLQTVANTWSCPSASYTLSGSSCSQILSQAFYYDCPTGYSLNGNSCSKQENTANSWSCPSASYSLSGSTCSLLETQAFSYNCPTNYTLSGSTCSQLQTAANTWSCPSASYSLSGSTCSLLETQGFSYNCPTNYTLSGSTCSQLQTVANTWSCPSASYSLSGSTCSLLETQAFSYNCPTNYTLSGSTCSQLQTAANTWNCPSASHTLSGSTCSLLETQAFSYSCPTNFTLSGSTCSQLQTAANTWSCPSASYSLSGSTCSLLETQAFSYSCPADYTRNNSVCSKVVNTANTWSCDANWTLSGSSCHSIDTLTYAYTCPDYYENHNDGTCTQLQNRDNGWTCPANYTDNNDGSCSWYQTGAYSLSCPDSSYTPNSTTEICEKVLTNNHIYKCNDPKYSLSGSSCSLLLTETESWVCADPSFNKVSDEQCKKVTNSNLVGTCPVGFIKSTDAKSCVFIDTTPLVKSCSASYELIGGECVKDVFAAPKCSSTIVDASCTCEAGMTLNLTTYQCEGIEKSSVLSSCPEGYTSKDGQCEYNKTVSVVYDYCPSGMSETFLNCVLKQEIPITDSCNAPYTVQGNQCKYVDQLPLGYASGVESKTFEGDIKTELSTIKVAKDTFDAIVSEISEIPLDDLTGCRLVDSEVLAQGVIKKGDVPCYIKWTDLPDGISGDSKKLTGIFKKSGVQSAGYELYGFNGSKLDEFKISSGSIALNVNEPEKPLLTDITTRLMSKVLKGFEMYNYSASSKLSMTTLLVEPRNYVQTLTVDGVGSCEVPVGANSCIVYSNISYTREPSSLQTDSNYIIKANSKIGGWPDEEQTKKDWVIHHDFRGPNIVFTTFNPTLEDEPVVNSDLSFPVVVAGGTGAVGVSNQRSELDSTEIWWRPSKVELFFTANEGTKSVNKLNVNGQEISFDIPNTISDLQTLTNKSVVSEGQASAYPFDMSSLTPGEYTVKVVAKDSYNNESTTTYENVFVSRPLPQIKVMHKSRSIEQLSSAQTINMLDDVMVVAHNGLTGDTEIKSIKIDGRDAITINSDAHFKMLTSEGFELDANKSYVMEVEAEDSNGNRSTLSMPFNYLQIAFALSYKPVTVIQKVEDVALAVNRTRGVRCDLYGTKAAATLASNDNNYACYIEWTQLPEGLSTLVTTYQSAVSGAVKNLGKHQLSYDAYIVNKTGSVGKVGSETVEFESTEPLPLTLDLDEKLKLSDGVYSVSINDTLLGRYTGKSSRAHVDVTLSNENGDEKYYKHNQLPFGEIQTFSAYAEKLGNSVLWNKIGYTLKASYRLAPEINIQKDFDLVVTPHPYMQVLMELDSPKYASTDTIYASVKLGLRNNATGLFEYNVATMGDGWDVYLAFKNGQVYEPITEVVEAGTDGLATIGLDANIIFERNQAVYAVAKAKSPYPEIVVERISTPRSITVVKGTAVEGQVISRLVQSRVPANFDIRFDTASYDDFRVLGDIDWQIVDSTGQWVTDDEFADRQYISIKSTSPETIKVRAVLTNKETGVITNSDEVTLISYDIPKLKIDGTNQAISGQDIELSALDNGEEPQLDTIVEWSLDNGETWALGDTKFNVVVGETALKIKARMKYASTSSEVQTGQWSEAIKYISVTKPKPLTVNVTKPSIVEVGTEIELKLQVVNPFAATGVDALMEWVLPDGSIVSNQDTLVYLVKEEDLDASKRLNMKGRAWLSGYKDVTLGESNITLNTFQYAFPTDDKLSLSVNNSVKFVPSTGFAMLNMPYINAPGVIFNYEWSFDEAAIEKTSSNGKTLNFKVIQAGIHKITLTLSDNRGNFTFIDGFVEAIEPDPLEFKVTDIYSNKYMRMPLTISLYPSVKSNHPYDFMKSYQWTVNGVQREPSSRAIGVFENLPSGHYEIELNVTSNFGQTGKHTMSFDVKDNQAPVCEPIVREQYGTHIVDANCKDSDGTISYYRWVVNGTVFTPYGAQVRFSANEFPSATIVIEAVDDAGAKGIGRANF